MHISCIQEYHVDVNAVVVTTSEDTATGPTRWCALHLAAFLDSANATCELLLMGADLLRVDGSGRTALDIAKERPTSPVLHILLPCHWPYYS